MHSDDHAHIVAPPPLLYLGGLVAVVFVHWFWPLALLPAAFAQWLAVAAILAGLAVNLWGVWTMRQARTAINPYQPTTNIVDSGPFAFSRNPLYVGMDLLFVGIIAWLNSLWGVPVLVLLLLVMHYGVILPEERYLEGRFDEAYSRYRAKVRRYI
jgi:protein-S-isoprenylcysteine O-methyltransferase Ste14